MIDKLKKKELCRERYHQLVAGYIYIYTLYVNQYTFVILYIAFPKIGAASLIQYDKNKKIHTKNLLLEYFSPTVPLLSSK